jgi:hypothetical protein
LPFSNDVFANKPGVAVTVGDMSMTDGLTDQLPQVLAPVLTVPLIQLYAVLWRVGVVEIVKTRQASNRQRVAALARAYSYQLRSA